MITVVLSTFGNIATAVLNSVSMIGLLYFSSYEILNEKSAIPCVYCVEGSVLISSAAVLSSFAVLGFVFWLLTVGATFHLYEQKEIQEQQQKSYWMLKMVLAFSVLVEFVFLFIMLQWNWFGPSKVI